MKIKEFSNNELCEKTIKSFQALGDKGNTLRYNVLNRMIELNKEIKVDNLIFLDLVKFMEKYSEAVDIEIYENGSIKSEFLSILYHHYLLLLIELETYLDYNYMEVLTEKCS